MQFLLRIARGEPRKMEPPSITRMHHAYCVCIAILIERETIPIRFTLTYYFSACYSKNSFLGSFGYARNNSECFVMYQDFSPDTIAKVNIFVLTAKLKTP